MTLSYVLRRGEDSAAVPAVDAEAQPSVVRDKLRALLTGRRFLPNGGTLAFPCVHRYHQDARFQRKPRPLSKHTVATLKGRDALVAVAALAEGLTVTFCPYLIETCADQTWQLERFPSPAAQQALGERLDPRALEKALAVRASADEPGDFGLVWVDPPPHFNGSPTLYPGAGDGRPPAPDPDLPAIAHLHGGEYSATGYFGNEGSDTDFYVYGALQVDVPPLGEPPRALGETSAEDASAPAPARRMT